MKTDTDLFEKKLLYVYNNYFMKVIANPTYDSKDRFPVELGGVLIGLWLHNNRNKIKELAIEGNKTAKAVLNNNKDKREMLFNDDKRVLYLIKYFAHFKTFPSIYNVFGDGTLMNEFLNNNKEWIYVNRESSDRLNLLVMLIEQIDPYYFEEVEEKINKTSNPTDDSKDRFSDSLGGEKIEDGIYRDKTLLDFVNKVDKKTIEVTNDFIKQKNNDEFIDEKLIYIYENYYKKDKLNPTVYDADSFPKELGGSFIGHWIYNNEEKIEELRKKGNEFAQYIFLNSKQNYDRIECVSELVIYILNNGQIPTDDDLFICESSMGMFLTDYREWIYFNKDGIDVLELLVFLIEQIDPDYFEDLKKESVKVKSLGNIKEGFKWQESL